MNEVVTFILGGGRGAGLYPLTKLRSVPAVSLAGKYRLIDVSVSNCINSGAKRIYVLTQFLSVSLHRHISNAYQFAPFSNGFVEVLAAQQTNEGANWYRGTADALRQNLRYINADPGRDVLILSGDGLYRMNYYDMVRFHRDSGADITIGAVPVSRERASGLGVLRVNEQTRIVELVEKPQTAEQLDALRTSPSWLERRGITSPDRHYLANMGVYLCRREVLLALLRRSSDATDLVTDYFARMLRSHQVHAYFFTDYWQDLGSSIRAYYEANLALASDNPPFDFHDPQGIIYTRARNLPASLLYSSSLEQSLVSDGCLIESGTRLKRCVVGQRLRIGRNVSIEDTVLCGADWYESDEQRRLNKQQGIPDMGIGDGSVISRAIIDKDCRIGRNVSIGQSGPRPDSEAATHVIRDGIIVIPRGTVIPDGSVL